VTFTVLQGQGVAGANPIAINAVPIFFNANTGSSDALVQQAAAASFAAGAGVTDKIVVFEITPEVCMQLSGAGGATPYNSIAIQTSASNAANITEATLYVLQSVQGASAPSTYV
jgi:hypothetical protein